MSHCTINKPHEMLPLSHSPSPDQLSLLCTPLVFATYHAIYGTCTKTSTPTIAFVLISSIQIKRDNRICPTLCISLCTFASHSHLHFAPCSHFTPCLHFTLHLHLHLTPLLHYPFTYLASLSGCIQLDSVLFTHLALSLPPPLFTYYHITHSCMLTHICACTTPPLFSPLYPHIETVPYPPYHTLRAP